MQVRAFLSAIALCFSVVLHAQTWQAVGGDSFESIAALRDGSMLVIRYPGDILRSTDRGATWHEIYHQLGRIEGIAEIDNRVVAIQSSENTLLISRDSGRSWKAEEKDEAEDKLATGDEPPHADKLVAGDGSHHAVLLLDDFSNVLLSRDSGASWERVLHVKEDYPCRLASISLVDSVCFAVGEPGLMYVSDSKFKHWTKLHAAPFGVDTASHRYYSSIQFFSPSSGAIAAGDRMYFTHDSGTTWSETDLYKDGMGEGQLAAGDGPPHANTLTALMLSDTSALAGGNNGTLVFTGNSGESYRSYNSLLSTSRPIIQIGWTNRPDGKVYILTDSALYFTNSNLESVSMQALALRSGEFAKSISFPDQYTGYLLTDSITRVDSVIHDGGFARDTILAHDSSTIYRSTDGGEIWTQMKSGVPGLSKISFVNTKKGFACGANGLILRTDDSGVTWRQSSSFTKQNLHDIQLASDSTGCVVGDSGVVLMEGNRGQWWRPAPPEPLFMHPSTVYTSVAFPDAHTVFVLGQSHCYKQRIQDPSLKWRINRRRTRKNPLSISVSPNPSSGLVHFVISSVGTTVEGGDAPILKISDLSGRTILSDVSCSSNGPGRWFAEADLHNQPFGPYMAIATLGGNSVVTNFMIER